MDEHNMEVGQALAEGAIHQGHRTRRRQVTEVGLQVNLDRDQKVKFIREEEVEE